MSDILDNSLDSLRMGLRHHLDSELEHQDKWAILELFHCIELLLKERLHREHPLLIYRSIDGRIDDDSKTVSLNEAVARLGNVGVTLSSDYRNILFDLQKRRNRIEHHRFVADQSHAHVLGKAIKFVRHFLEDELETDIEAELPPEQFLEAKELVFEYDELMAKAKAGISADLRKSDPKEDYSIGECPECGNQTVLVRPDSSEPSSCYYCEKQVFVHACERCGGYFAPELLYGVGICGNCLMSIGGG